MLLASLSVPWDMCGDICFPNLLQPRCVLTIPCKWPQRVVAGEGGARDTQAVRWWLPHGTWHVLMEKDGRGRNNLGCKKSPRAMCLVFLEMLVLLELDLCPRVIQVMLSLGQHSQR